MTRDTARRAATGAIGRRGLLGLLLTATLLVGCQRPTPDGAPVVFAAASLQEVLEDASAAWASQGRRAPLISFAGSSALARQIQAGAAADLFISADEAWMDAVEQSDRIDPASRAIVAGNRLVLAAPRATARPIGLDDRAAFLAALGDGRLAIADPDSVPAGRYAKAALTRLQLWSAVEGRLAPAENVRAALALVERGASPLAAVYETDVQAASDVVAVAVFPADTHPPIVYPIARLSRSDNPEAEAFRRFLLSEEGQALFAARGFAPAGGRGAAAG